MTSKVIRYRYAMLLLWASMALVSNPLWHAISHDHSDHGDEAVVDIFWVGEDLCPHCDAVSQFAALPAIGVLQCLNGI